MVHARNGGKPAICYHPMRFNHITLARALIVPEERHLEAQRWGKAAQKIRESDADVAVISAEEFESVSPERLHKALETYLPELAEGARLIAYVRPHAQRLTSSYSEMIKVGAFRGPIRRLHEKSLKQERWIYTPRFETWRAVYGSRFELRPMIRDRLQGADVVTDFFGLLLGEAASDLPEFAGTNESVSLESLSVLREFHVAVDGIGRSGAQFMRARTALAKELARLLSTGAGGRSTRVALDQALAAEVVADYRADAAALDAAFFDGTPMTDALGEVVGKACPKPQSILAKDHFNPLALSALRASIGLSVQMLAAEDKDGLHRLAVASDDEREARILGRPVDRASKVGGATGLIGRVLSERTGRRTKT